jgi:hypothetical protein
MKKVLLTLALVTMLSSSAFAWEHQGNHNNHWSPKHWFGFGHNNHGQNPNAQLPPPLSEDVAKAAVEEYIKRVNIRGYTITGVATDSNYGINVVSATDVSNNEMVFFVNPYGQVNGPILKNQ